MPEERPLKLNVGTIVLIVIGALVFGYFAGHYPFTPQRVIGLCIAAIALALLLIARLQLGRAFNVDARASELVTSGLYARVRNPIYIFGSLLLGGVILWSGNPWYFLVFAILIPMQVIRARTEARVLEDKFGDAYREYRRKTWF